MSGKHSIMFITFIFCINCSVDQLQDWIHNSTPVQTAAGNSHFWGPLHSEGPKSLLGQFSEYTES